MKKGLAPFFLSLSLLLTCATYRLEKDLEPEQKEFLSEVRYIITQQERKTFLRLPPSEREAFIKEFWKKRDSDPETEKNEFKEQYFKRIEQANNLFSEGGTQGWLQDRGRIYVIFGPPEQREVYPRGFTFYDPPMEIWHYGFYRLTFIDYRWNSNYVLIPESARLLAEINTAQMMLKPEDAGEKIFFDFNLNEQTTEEGGVLIQVEVPYKTIWFSSEGNKFQTTLELSLEVSDLMTKKVVLQETNGYPLSFTEEDLKELIGKYYLIEVPLRLAPGNYVAIVTIKNTTDKNQVRRKIKLTIQGRCGLIGNT